MRIKCEAMNEAWVDRWNDRYSKPEFAYGEEPNNYLKEQLEKLPGTGSVIRFIGRKP